jgi:hypothetical protein
VLIEERYVKLVLEVSRLELVTPLLELLVLVDDVVNLRLCIS